MKHIKIFEEFNDDFYDDEPLSRVEQQFGRQTVLQKKYSEIVQNGLASTNKKADKFWSTFVALTIEMRDIIDEGDDLYKEMMSRIVDGEDAQKVISDICKKLPDVPIDVYMEIDRLVSKLKSLG